MQNLLSKINIDSFEDFFIDIDEFHKDYKNNLEKAKILIKESAKYKSDATFDSSIWILLNNNTLVYSIINFNKVEDMIKLKLINKEDYLILKCWITEKLLSSAQPASQASIILHVLKIFTDTKGFNVEFIDTPKGNTIKTFIEYSPSDSVKNSKITLLKEYLNFIDRIGFVKEGYKEALLILNEYRTSTRKSSIRKLPSNTHIFNFDYYIKDFFKSDNNILLKKIYYPLLIWWKVTNIIPMRPSEIAGKTTRNCLIKEDDKYYLKINRVKLKRTDSSIYKAQIPILNKVEISKEIYDLISEYINFTDFAESNTLFSWNAMNEFKSQYSSEISNDSADYLPVFNTNLNKFDTFSFNRDVLEELLDSFYKQILEKQYGYVCDNEDRLDIGDTRHLAFASLHLQGLSPVEIAMLGGHTTLEMQDSYTNHVQYYIDNEILNLISGKIVVGSNTKMFNSLKKIVFSKPLSYKLNLNLSDFEKTDDGVGYCLLNNDDDFCDDVPHCIFCNKWWCEPSNDSFKALKQFLLNNKINPLEKEIKAEEEFFAKLINEAKIVNINGLAEIDKSDDNAIKSQSLKIRAKADKLAFLKASLLEAEFEKSKEISNE